MSLTILDLSYLQSIIGNDDEFLGLVLSEYRRGIDQKLEALETAIGKKDEGQAARIAHDIKGSSRTVGAIKMADISQSVERAAKVADWGSCSEHMHVLRLVWNETNKELAAA